ncbi:fructosamine kinase family protein [Kushneria indalinina]|uniref:Fructosamine-3-kinase n=1 Tax=Kushneria indalinina DSM 14324 TaxID=1122140 RepID=A0A3D9DZP6_9GAMM|nr:fructosamine kinase family protein [Kushneria indalinina]REC96272.1 fructosamine-3-kinase [Kushneria indalinina DSM 14324]
MTSANPQETLERLGISATTSPEPLRGGDIGQVWRVTTRQGDVLVKHADSEGLEAEADGLKALREADTGLIVPDIVGELPGALVMTYLPPARPDRHTHEAFGRGLRALHANTSTDHGWHRDNFAGTTPQINTCHEDGRVFQRECRLLPLAERCLHKKRMDQGLYDQLAGVANALESWLSDAPASLVHGDLWSGNVHFSTQGPALIDPAIYRHYPEADLALLELFGSPADAFYEAYWDGGMPDDWPRRRALFQLYPLLNHLYMFGGSYYQGVRSAIAQLPGH